LFDLWLCSLPSPALPPLPSTGNIAAAMVGRTRGEGLGLLAKAHPVGFLASRTNLIRIHNAIQETKLFITQQQDPLANQIIHHVLENGRFPHQMGNHNLTLFFMVVWLAQEPKQLTIAITNFHPREDSIAEMEYKSG
jgi:hypothetical protein